MRLLEPDMEAPAEASDSTQLKYVHKEHRFRVQSYIVKELKKEMSISFDSLVSRVANHFRQSKDLLIDMSPENIQKNIDDLIEKSYVSRDEDLGVYEYVRD
jgi:hypothetical protein